MTFVDVPNAGGMDFIKWRARKHGVESRCYFMDTNEYFNTMLNSSFDYILFLDVIEHLKRWQRPIKKFAQDLKRGGVIICNFNRLLDFTNAEHIFMDKKSAKEYFIKCGLFPHGSMYYLRDFSDFKHDADEVPIQ